MRKAIAHPLPLAAALLLAVNDHLLKHLWPGFVTGKLSDFAGLFFFPMLLPASPEVSVLATGVVFAALKTCPAFNGAVSSVVGPNALDPTDLWALTMLPLSWLWMRRAPLRDAPAVLQRAAVVAASVASLATTVSPGHWERNKPVWTAAGPQPAGCAQLSLGNSKSGKQGMGIDLEWVADRECRVVLQSATLRLRGSTIAGETGSVREEEGEHLGTWLAFPFDGDAAWNEGARDAVLSVELTAGGAPATARFRLTQHMDGALYFWKADPPREQK